MRTKFAMFNVLVLRFGAVLIYDILDNIVLYSGCLLRNPYICLDLHSDYFSQNEKEHSWPSEKNEYL